VHALISAIRSHDETNIGAILKANKIQRSAVYITTKVTAGCGKQPDCAADAAVSMASVKQVTAHATRCWAMSLIFPRAYPMIAFLCELRDSLRIVRLGVRARSP
jgi:hypothetical protein